MKACSPKSSDGTCWRRRCLRCRWNNITGQSRRRREALRRRMDDFRARAEACDHDYRPAWSHNGKDWLACAKNCGSLTYQVTT